MPAGRQRRTPLPLPAVCAEQAVGVDADNAAREATQEITGSAIGSAVVVRLSAAETLYASTATESSACCWLPDLEQVHHEDQRLAGPDDATGATVTVGEVGGYEQLSATADLHALHAPVPALDDLPDAESERQRFAAVVGSVELLAGGVGHSDVVDDDRATGGGLRAVALDDVGDDQVGGRLPAGNRSWASLQSSHDTGRWSPGSCRRVGFKQRVEPHQATTELRRPMVVRAEQGRRGQVAPPVVLPLMAHALSPPV